MRTYVAKGEEAEALKVGARGFVVDATNQVLGRLATRVARILIGKDKAAFTPYLDSGDHVVVINAHNIRMTGNKGEHKAPSGVGLGSWGETTTPPPAAPRSCACTAMPRASRAMPARSRRLSRNNEFAGPGLGPVQFPHVRVSGFVLANPEPTVVPF